MPPPGREALNLGHLKHRVRELKREVAALYFAAQDPETPAVARAVIFLVAAYALSPVDLIPDWIPVLGYVDDLLIVPLGITIALRLVPHSVMTRARERAQTLETRPRSLFGLGMVVLAWILLSVASIWLVRSAMVRR